MLRAPMIVHLLTISLAGLCSATAIAQAPEVQRDPVAGATYYERMKLLTLADGDPGGIVFTVRGKVVSPDGEPAVGAMVVLRESSTRRISSNHVPLPITSTRPWVVNDVFARTTTDANGAYEFANVAAPIVVERYQKSWDWDVVAAAPNGHVGWSQLKRGYTVPESIELQRDVVLRETNPISGTLLSAQGQPIAGTFVRSTSLSQLEKDSGLFPSINTLNLNASSLQLSVRTDENGKFTFPAIPRGLVASVFFRNPHHSFISVRITSSEVFSTLDPTALADSEKDTIYGKILGSPATIRAIPQLKIRGVLRDELGSPLSGQKIMMGSFTSYAETDGQGRFEWPISEPSLRMHSFAEGDERKTMRFYVRELGGNYISLVHEEPIANLLASKEVQLLAKKGVEVSGTVVTKDAMQPIANVRVIVTPANDSDPLKVVSAVTGDNGTYRIVAPKVRAIVSISGTISGLALPNGRNSLGETESGEFSQVIDLRQNESVTLPPFEVEQMEGVQIHVVDDQANPIEAAHVTAFYLTSPKPPSTYRSHRELSPPATTDQQGFCLIFPKIPDWEDGVVRAEGKVNGERWFGSELLPTDAKKPITVNLKSPWRVFGRVLLNVTFNGRYSDALDGQRPGRKLLASRSWADLSGCCEDRSIRIRYFHVQIAASRALKPDDQDRRWSKSDGASDS